MNQLDSYLEIKDKTNLSDSIKITPFKSDTRKTTPHKHNNYFEIIYLSAGSGQHTIDTQEYVIKPPIIFVIRKEQIHFWEIKSVPSGFVMIIKKSFLNEILDRELKQLFTKLSACTCLVPYDNNSIEQIFHLLTNEYLRNQAGNISVVEGLLKALLAKMLQSNKSYGYRYPGKDNIIARFRELLDREDQLTNNVAYYAGLLHMSPQNLNAMCRRETNQTAAQVISEYIINEAKRLLLFTNQTVIQISFALDFKDNSHFTKYFRRHTGITPNAYRHISR